MTLFKNKYRIESIRLKHWDYSSDGAYFITICTKNRRDYFGKIRNGIMGLNETGNAAAICWQDIPLHFPFTELDAWVVMPNHVHGVIIINKSSDISVETVETRHGASPQSPQIIGNANKFGPLISKSLQSIINQYKGAVKRWCNKNNHPDFLWQSLYYDHIIRDENELNRICEYIQNNPWKWQFDRNNSENLWM